MTDNPSLFIGFFGVELSLTCPCNNIFLNNDIVTPHNLSPEAFFQGPFYWTRSQGHLRGQRLRGSGEDLTCRDLS